ncbi:hypothetical protein PsalMR5_04353 (plasmid) [Piscirickettsia salmonis]|nr:hypothetical protein PsalBI1_04217 [Piscirickettsia salmonis]QGP66428.1 hypothetical protein PsalMR5_04353 [Piscirickettsia salmonis]
MHEYGSQIAKRLRPHFRQTCASWRLDETLVKIKGRWYYLYRANKFAQNSIYLSSQQATRYFGKLPLRVVMRFVFFRSKLRGIRPLAIDIMEAMRMVQKGQLRYIKKQNICAQNQLIDKLFGLAA